MSNICARRATMLAIIISPASYSSIRFSFGSWPMDKGFGDVRPFQCLYLAARRFLAKFQDKLRFINQLRILVSRLHEKGIIHGDIKPSNLLLCSDEEMRFCDFGDAAVDNEEDIPRAMSAILIPVHVQKSIFVVDESRGSLYDGNLYVGTIHRTHALLLRETGPCIEGKESTIHLPLVCNNENLSQSPRYWLMLLLPTLGLRHLAFSQSSYGLGWRYVVCA
jgi:hypothetical protein